MKLRTLASLSALVAVFTVGQLAISPASGQQIGPQSVQFRVTGATQRLEMIVNTSRILTLDFDAPRMLVNNTQLVRATPLSPNQIQLSALQPGITQINIWDRDGQVRSLDVVVTGDARALQDLINSEFPSAAVRVRPSNGTAQGSVILSGFVPNPNMVNRIVLIAQDFYPNVINNMTVGGVQQVMLHVKVVEVSRTKLRQFGIDWAAIFGNDYIISSAANLISAAATTGGTITSTAPRSLTVGVLTNGNQFGAVIDMLRQKNLAKLLAEPTLVTVSGRPASFNSGGEVPVPIANGLGTTSVEFREFGTQIDFVPIVRENGMIRLEVRPVITEVDDSLTDQVTGTPGFRSRRLDTGAEMRAGQTLALAGLIQNRVSSVDRGIPYLADLPLVGAMFGRVEQRENEIELLIMVTPEFVTAMEPHEVPACGPGQATAVPSDSEFYFRRYTEVPKCNPCDNGSCRPVTPDFMMSNPRSVPYPTGSNMTYPSSQNEQFAPSTQAPSVESIPFEGETVNPQFEGRRPAARQAFVPQQRPAASNQQRPEMGNQQPAMSNQQNPYANQPAPLPPAQTYGFGRYPETYPGSAPAANTTSQFPGGEPQLIGPSGYGSLQENR